MTRSARNGKRASNTTEYAHVGLGEMELGRAYQRGSDDAGKSEYGWGGGLTPAGCEHAPPNQGGRYRGKAATLDDPPDPHVGQVRCPR